MKMMQAVIFDMDGLLLDTERVAFKVFNDIIGQYGLHIDLQTFARFVGLTKRDFIKAIEDELDGLGNTENLIGFFYEQVENELSKSAPDVKKGAIKLINYLRAHEIPIAVATSTHELPAKQLLRRTGLKNFFDIVVTGDMVSEGKPSPDIFLETFKQLKCDPQHTVVLEDSANGIRAAYASGAQPILIPDIKIPPKEVQKLATQKYPSLLDFLYDIRKDICNYSSLSKKID